MPVTFSEILRTEPKMLFQMVYTAILCCNVIYLYITAIGAVDLADTLATGGPFTVFAPTNDAFAKIPKETPDGLLADKDALTKLLQRHVVPKTLFYKGICWSIHNTAGGAEEDMIATQVFNAGVVKVVSNVEGKMTGAMVVDTDIIATNGVIHAIDTVI